MKRQVRVIVETERTLEVGHSIIATENWCDDCDGPATMLSIEMAAAIARLGSGAIYHWIEHSQFHFQRTRTGALLICQKSFLDHLRRINFLPKPKGGIPGEAKR